MPSVVLAGWNRVEEGLEYRREGEPAVHFFRIDPSRYRLDLLLASDYKLSALAADNYRSRSGALLVINGGFFDEAFRSLGLLYRRGQTVNPVRKAAWGIFLVGAGGPRVIHQKEWSSDGVTTAIQVGPRLIVDGKIQRFKEGVPSRRSAIGVTKEGWVMIALSETPLTLKEWAETLQKDCPQALNLDGGGSSQLSAAFPGLSLKVEGVTTVPNTVAVFKK